MPVSGGIKAGKITKPYGLQGHVNLKLEPEAGELIEIENPLFVDIDGQRVPFFVEEFDQTSDNQSVIKFEFINSIEEARKYCGCEVYSAKSKNISSQAAPNEFRAMIGYTAIDRELGHLGMITAYVKNEFNPVLIVNFKGKELLIPAVHAIIYKLDHKERFVLFNLPKGLTSV